MKGLLFTYGMTYGGSLVALFRPFTGFLIYLSFSILKPDFLWSFSVPRGTYSRTVFIALLIGWFLSGCGNWRFGRARGIVIALSVYFLWTLLSAVAAPDQSLAWTIVWEVLKTVGGVLVGLSLIESRRQITQIAWVLVVSMTYLAYEFNVGYYAGNNWLVVAGFAGMDDKGVATTLVIGAGLAVFLAVSTPRLPLKLLAVGGAILMLHVPLFVHSRGGMMGLIAAAVMAFVLLPKKPIHMLVFAAVLILGVRLAGTEVREQFSTSFAGAEQDWSIESRLILWEQAWDTTLHHPVFGIGPRQWQRHSTTEYGWTIPKEVHNTWLQTGAELGIPGALALMLFFLIPIVKLWRMRKASAKGSFERIYASMIVVGLAGFAVTSQFITIYGLEAPYFIVMIGAGLLKVTSAEAATVPERKPVAMSSALRLPSRTIPSPGPSA